MIMLKKNFFYLFFSILFSLFITEIYLKFIYFNKADLQQVKPHALYALPNLGDVFKPYKNFLNIIQKKNTFNLIL